MYTCWLRCWVVASSQLCNQQIYSRSNNNLNYVHILFVRRGVLEVYGWVLGRGLLRLSGHLLDHHLLVHHLLEYHLLEQNLLDQHLQEHHLLEHHLLEHHLLDQHLLDQHLLEHHLLERHLLEHHLLEHHRLEDHPSPPSCSSLEYCFTSRRFFPHFPAQHRAHTRTDMLQEWPDILESLQVSERTKLWFQCSS